MNRGKRARLRRAKLRHWVTPRVMRDVLMGRNVPYLAPNELRRITQLADAPPLTAEE